MSIRDELSWRERAVAVAALGAATFARTAFRPASAPDPPPLEMQVLVALAVGDSLTADPPRRTSTHWLTIALRLEQGLIEELVGRLERANLVWRSTDIQDVDEVSWELGGQGDDDAIARELPIALTGLGVAHVHRWLARAKPHFAQWPPEPLDVDDAVE